MKGRKKVFLSIACILLLAMSSLAVYVNYELNKIKKVSVSDNGQDLSKNSGDTTASDSDIINIALLGVNDTTPDEGNQDPNASDSIMVLSIDKAHKKIKLISVLRDTYVYTPETDYTKINYTFSAGGAPLTVKALNSNFKLNIQDYAVVDFKGFKSVIDALGGVSIDIKDYEVPIMRKAGINSSGIHNLNGTQALLYCRTRKVGYADFERSDRQRAVMNQIFDKIKSAGVSKYPAIINAVLPYVTTNMTNVDMIKMGTTILASDITSIDQTRFPVDGYWVGRTIGTKWYLVPYQPAATDWLQNYIYGNNSAAKN